MVMGQKRWYSSIDWPESLIGFGGLLMGTAGVFQLAPSLDWGLFGAGTLAGGIGFVLLLLRSWKLRKQRA
jgi:hypothetical protein